MNDCATSPDIIIIMTSVVWYINSVCLRVSSRIHYTAFAKFLSYLSRAIALHTQEERFFYNFGSFFINNPMILIFRVFDVAVRWIGAKRRSEEGS